MTFREALNTKRLYFDGGMGTMLIEAGMPAGGVPDLLNLENPEMVRGIHQKYLRAGCDIVTTNTFGANRVKLPGHDIGELVGAAVELALDACRSAGGKRRYTALDIGPTGHLLKPLGDLPFEEAYQAFAEMVGAGSGADLIVIETMTDLYELKAAVLAAKENSALPVVATVSVDQKGRLLTGADISCVVALLEGLRVDALGINCSLPPHLLGPVVEQLAGCCSIPVVLSPNAGLPDPSGGQGHESPEAFASDMAALARLGAHLLGGCCGTTPEHIEQLINHTRDIPLPGLCAKNRTVVCSGSRSVVMGEMPIMIGERLNPTGKKRLKAALLEGQGAYLESEALSQQECGAHVLDVNVGLPGLDEPAVMVWAVELLQGVTQLPLQLDSADPETLEAALRIYNGKALINSVNGKRESMVSVFPLAAKYGGVLVGLPLDENGIPDTAAGRLAIARRIVETAAEYGIAAKDIVIDGLTLAVSANPAEAVTTLDTIKLVREHLGVNTVLGVSNVSFGMPRRDLLNSSFLTAALHAGLSAAIINPCAQAMTDAWNAFMALRGMDAGFTEYTSRYGGNPQAEASPPAEKPALARVIREGLVSDAANVTRELLKQTPPSGIIDGHIVPALNLVGEDYESGRTFLPQLLRSAEAAQNAFEVLRESIPDARSYDKATVVIATVKGDVHDIGKNIAKVILANQGYRVIDLGKDVSPDDIAESAMQNGADFVGLSALMTTTVGSMAKTIERLRETGYGGRVMVSGAVMTAEYAEKIGADAYVKDAMAAALYMEKNIKKW